MTGLMPGRSWSVETIDVLEGLRAMPADSVHCVVTSPPYWGLRDYGTEGQIGLERTPDEFIAKMVEVFAAVRGVMRDDGTLWLNIGDSFNAYNGGAGPGGWKANRDAARPQLETGYGLRCRSLKPKDLVGIPWKLAEALKAPQYTGRIPSVTARTWLAAMIDGEGCIFIHKRGAGLHAGDGYYRKSDTFSPALGVYNTNRRIVERCKELAGVGSIQCKPEKRERARDMWAWEVRGEECRQLLREVYDCLVAKQWEARLAIGCPTNGEAADNAHAALKSLHRGGTPDVDFPAPASLYEPGWYLRSEIIWHKKSPMPESVRDRPTKAHEQIFLLTKKPVYFYDAIASAERATHAGKTVSLGDKSFSRGQAIGAGVSPSGNGLADTYNVPAGRNMRSVWTLSTEPFAQAHFATFPTELVRRCLLAGTSEKGCCPTCGAPWKRVLEKERRATRPAEETKVKVASLKLSPKPGKEFDPANWQNSTLESVVGNRDPQRHVTEIKTVGWKASCECGGEPIPCLVLDPFAGSGTTLVVARRLGLRAIGLELNPLYAEMARKRIVDDAPLLNNF